ncbi:MAG: serine/threonine protein kinase [Candidatus Wallbacteria bacterium]|nr:serine/threonine protein kinase [Candidatus Wallbacteria bacterium]
MQWFPEDWDLLRKLGTGSMGEVFEGRHRPTGQVAALKCVADARAGQPAFVARFADEVRILERLVHPGVVRLIDAGLHEGQPWLALELVRGASLRDRLRAGPLPSKEAVSLARQLAEALAYVHDQGVIHGDLKPENVLLDEAGRAKIADFGLAGLAEAYATGVGPIVSGFTAAYAAPEQLRDAQKSQPPADLYALGRMLFEMLTGRLPAGRESLSEARPGSGRRLEKLLSELLRPDPAGRPSSAREVARQLAEVTVDLERMGLAIETIPAGASVALDGTPLGPAPTQLPGVAEGRHTAVASAPGFHEHLEEFELVPGRTMTLKLALAPVACPHCGQRTASEESALAHEAACSRVPRVPSQAPRRAGRSSRHEAARTQGAAKPLAAAASEALAASVLWLVRRSERVSGVTVVKLAAALAALQLAARAAERWEHGLPLTTIVVAWLALAGFVLLVDRAGKHPGPRR